MTRPQPPSPPAKAERLLARCLPRGALGGTILGDLRQEYALLCRRSPRKASLWYWIQALRIGSTYFLAHSPSVQAASGQAPS